MIMALFSHSSLLPELSPEVVLQTARAAKSLSMDSVLEMILRFSAESTTLSMNQFL